MPAEALNVYLLGTQYSQPENRKQQAQIAKIVEENQGVVVNPELTRIGLTSRATRQLVDDWSLFDWPRLSRADCGLGEISYFDGPLGAKIGYLLGQGKPVRVFYQESFKPPIFARDYNEHPLYRAFVYDSSDMFDELVKGVVNGIESEIARGELMVRNQGLMKTPESTSGQNAAQFRVRMTELGDLQLFDLFFDTSRMEVRLGGKVVNLTPTEYKLLRFLAAQFGKTVSNKNILLGVWGSGQFDESMIRTNIHRVRSKLELAQEGAGQYIVTRAHIGYVFIGNPMNNLTAQTEGQFFAQPPY